MLLEEIYFMLNDFVIKYMSAHNNRDVNKLSKLYKLPFLLKDGSGGVSYLETSVQLKKYVDHRLNEMHEITSMEYVGDIGRRFKLFNSNERVSSKFITHHLVLEKIEGVYLIISED